MVTTNGTIFYLVFMIVRFPVILHSTSFDYDRKLFEGCLF